MSILDRLTLLVGLAEAEALQGAAMLVHAEYAFNRMRALGPVEQHEHVDTRCACGALLANPQPVCLALEKLAALADGSIYFAFPDGSRVPPNPEDVRVKRAAEALWDIYSMGDGTKLVDAPTVQKVGCRQNAMKIVNAYHADAKPESTK